MQTSKLINFAAVLGACLVTNVGRADSYSVDVPTSYKIVGNQVDNPPNALTTHFSTLPSGSRVYTYQPGTGYAFGTKKGVNSWSQDLAVNRGEAAYVLASAPSTITFSGSSTLTPVDLTTTIGFDPVNAFYLRASQVFDPNNAARQYTYHDITGTDPVEDVVVYKPLVSGVPPPTGTPFESPGAWETHTFKYGTWSPAGEPTILAGEGVWIGPKTNLLGLVTPWVFSLSPRVFNAVCGGTITVHGANITAGATVELLPGPIMGSSVVVNGSGTELTATLPGGITPGNYQLVVKNSPTDSSAPFNITVGGPKIKSRFPAQVGTCEAVKVTIIGGGFCPLASLIATPNVGGSAVAATSVTVSPEGDVITGTFSSGSLNVGMHSLSVQNPGAGGADTLTLGLDVGAFGATLVPAKQPAGNCGVTAITLNGAFCPTDEFRLVSTDGNTVLGGTATSFTSLWMGYKQAVVEFNFLNASLQDYRAEVRRAGGTWSLAPGTVTVHDTGFCPVFPSVAGRSRIRVDRDNGYAVTVCNLSCASVPASTLTVSFPASDNAVFSSPSVGGVVSPLNVVTFNIPALAAGQSFNVGFMLRLLNNNTTCDMSVVDSISGCNAVITPIEVVGSQDPNSKDGLAGIGAGRAIAGNEMLPYEIHFENKPSASAPAQDVFVSDRLDPAMFDLATFSLGEFKFGDRVITPPPGLASYSEVVMHDRDGNPATTADQMLVVVSGELVTDPAAADLGRLTWSYRTLDPLTMASPLDPDLGFLPPNTVSPVGEGSVKFSVKLNLTLGPGTRMGSGAVIIFDSNAPIATNPWYNEIANDPILVMRPNGDQVEIEWVGTPGAYTLEEKSQLGAGLTWTTVSTPPVSVGGDVQRVTLTPEGDQKYFRLRR